MEIVKSTDAYQVVKKRSGRYGVRGANRKWIGGEEKVKILIAEGLLKAPTPKAEEAAPAEEEASAEATEETPSEE